jgi:hypothetical protein
MLKIFVFIIYTMFLRNNAISQRIYPNNYLRNVDEPFQFLPEAKMAHYHSMSIYKCQDSVFKKSECTCTEKDIINDSGRVIKMILGNDIEKGEINYTINYLTFSDSICTVITEYTAHFIDSTFDFMYDTTINKKRKKVSIYDREANNDLIIKSILIFKVQNELKLPDTVFRFSRTGQLKEIYYPLGNKKPLQEWNDSSTTSTSKTKFHNEIFKDHESHEYAVYSKKGLKLEEGYSNRNIPEKNFTDIRRTIFIYIDSSKLLAKHTIGANNQFIQDENFFYDNENLSKYTLKNNLYDSIENEVKLYNNKGQIIEKLERANGYPYDLWQYFYAYKKNLQASTFCYRNKKFLWSIFFLYE